MRGGRVAIEEMQARDARRSGRERRAVQARPSRFLEPRCGVGILSHPGDRFRAAPTLVRVMSKHVSRIVILSFSSLLAAGCDGFLDLEPDPDPEPPDAGPSEPQPDAAVEYPPLPPPEAFPDEPVVTTPAARPAPPPVSAGEGVEVVFPPPASITVEPRVTMRGTARLDSGVTAVHVNGVAARLSEPNDGGAVAWQVEITPALGRNDIVVSSTDGNGDVTAEAARATLEHAPYMLVQPHALALDVGHDRLFVSDPGARGIVAIDLETGVPGHVEIDLGPDRPVVPHALSIDVAAGRGAALFRHHACYGQIETLVAGILDIDLQAGSFEIEDRVIGDAECYQETYTPEIRDAALVLDTGKQMAFTLYEQCAYLPSVGECTVEVRAISFGAGALPDGVWLCTSDGCAAEDLIADGRDPASSTLLALVRHGPSYDRSVGLHAVDPIAGTETRIATVQQVWNEALYFPKALALDPAGNRAFVVANGGLGVAVIAIDLASGAQSWVGGTGSDGIASWSVADAVYDHRRERVIFSVPERGLYAVDLDTGAFTRLFRPTIGEGPTPSCSDNCMVSNVDDTRQRILVHENADGGSNIYALDLGTGNRHLLSERGNSTELGRDPLLLADHPDDRVLAWKTTGELYRVDGTTGDRVDTGLSLSVDVESAAWDPERNRILYLSLSGLGSELRAFDVDTGEDALISSNAVGSGPSLDALLPGDGSRLVSLDASGTHALLSELSEPVLISVDLVTGDRTAVTLIDPVGPLESRQQALVDMRRDRLLVRGAPAHQIMEIELGSGGVGVFMDLGPISPASPVPGPVGAGLAYSQLLPDHPRDRALIVDQHRGVQMLDLLTGQRVHVLHFDP